MTLMHRLANREYLFILALLPVVVVIATFYSYLIRKKTEAAFSATLYPFLSSSLSAQKRKIKLILELVVLALMIVALARPQAGKSEQNVKSEGVELMILFDVSQSMLTEDVRPSRLELAKKEISNFLELSGDRVGLVAFAGSSVLLSPLTADKNAMRMYIESLTTESVSTQGTDFKSALSEALNAFERGGVEDPTASVVTRAIVLVSDGEDNEKGADEILKKIEEKNIRLFTLAVGTEKGGPIPLYDENRQLRGYRKDRSDKVVLSQTKGTVLKEMAKEADGSFYPLTVGGGAIRALQKDLSKLEKSQFENAVVVNYDEKFQWFLLPAVLLALIELALGERRSAGRIWKGRFEVAEA